jgi:hypothetical protein
MSALPGVPVPVASANGSPGATAAPVTPADAAATAVASLRPISDGTSAPPGRLIGRSTAALVVGAVAALIVLRRVLLARKAGR